jgi:hypothetical protein
VENPSDFQRNAACWKRDWAGARLALAFCFALR